MAETIDLGSREKHAIAHSLALTGQVLGAALGAVIGGAIVIGVVVVTGGIGLVAAVSIMIAAIGLVSAIGKAWGGTKKGHRSGEIARGSPTIYYGPYRKPAARLMDPLKCEDPLVSLAESAAASPLAILSPGLMVGVALGLHNLLGAHPDSFIGAGVKNIIYDTNFVLASRIKDKTSCGGSVDEGEETILLGGETFYVMDPAQMTEDSAAMWWIMFGLDVVGLLFGVSEVKFALKLVLPMLAPWALRGLGMAVNAAGYPTLAGWIGAAEKVLGYGVGGRTRIDKGNLAADLVAVYLGFPEAPEKPVSAEDAAYRRQVMRRSGASKAWYNTQYQLPAN
jgi:hypothetical protein